MWVKPRNWGVGGHTFFEAGGKRSDADLVRFYYGGQNSEMVVELGDGSEPTNCCLGDDKLYVTLSGPGQLISMDRAAQPLALYPFRS